MCHSSCIHERVSVDHDDYPALSLLLATPPDNNFCENGNRSSQQEKESTPICPKHKTKLLLLETAHTLAARPRKAHTRLFRRTIYTMARKSPNIILTGTPGVGKTTHAEQLARATGLKHVSVNHIVKDEGFHEGKDEETGSWIVDEDKVTCICPI